MTWSPYIRIVVAYTAIMMTIAAVLSDGINLKLAAVLIGLSVLGPYSLLFEPKSDIWMNLPYSLTLLACAGVIVAGLRTPKKVASQAIVTAALVVWNISSFAAGGLGS